MTEKYKGGNPTRGLHSVQIDYQQLLIFACVVWQY